MGRGRAKAKQQKVARDLKYNSQPTDLDALQRELGHSPHGTSTFVEDDAEEDDGDDWASAAR